MAEQEKKVPQEQEKKDKLDSNLKSYLMIALLVFVVFCCCILVFFLIYRYNGFASGWRKLMKVLQPIIIGLVVAYLLNPVMMFLESHLKTLFSKKIHDEKKVWKMSRGIGIALSLLLLVLIVYGLLMMVIPQLIQSITGMFTSLPDEVALGVTYENIDDYLEGKALDEKIAKTIEGWYLKTEHKRRPPITVFDDFWKK